MIYHFLRSFFSPAFAPVNLKSDVRVFSSQTPSDLLIISNYDEARLHCRGSSAKKTAENSFFQAAVVLKIHISQLFTPGSLSASMRNYV